MAGNLGDGVVLSRDCARPLGLPDSIVELPAVHFHYAGYVAPVLTFDSSAGRGSDVRELGRRSCVWPGCRSPALGFTVSPEFGTAGAILLAAGLTTGSVVTLVTVVPATSRPASLALAISSSSVVVAMLLAIVYSLGGRSGMPAGSIAVMAWTHGGS